MPETKRITRFQVVACMVRRDGLHLKAIGPLYRSVKDAMEEVVKLEQSNELFVYFRIRGLAKGDPESPKGFRPFIKDRRAVKLYALKVSPYPEGKEPAGHPGPGWYWAWGRSESEARGTFRHSSPQYRAYHVHAIAELTLEQENEFLQARTVIRMIRLIREYGEMSLNKSLAAKEEEKHDLSEFIHL